MDIATLARDGFVSVAYPASLRPIVVRAMSSWQEFCTLPDNKKRLLSGGDRLRDLGYMRRQDKGKRADNKEIFHAKLSTLDALNERAKLLGDRRALEFMYATGELIVAALPLIREFAAGVEDRFRLSGFAREVEQSQRHWTFRYLHYLGGEMLAHPHADRGGFTFHMYEDAPGGEYLDLSGAWQAWPVDHERTIIFPSMGLQYRSRGKLKALWHQVVPTPETRVSGRYSMVAFIDFAMGHRYNDAIRRVQDFSPGFNYAMGQEEFESLFIPAESQTV